MLVNILLDEEKPVLIFLFHIFTLFFFSTAALQKILPEGVSGHENYKIAPLYGPLGVPGPQVFFLNPYVKRK